MNEIYELKFNLKINGEYKEVELLAVEVRLEAHNLIIFEYYTEHKLEYEMKNIKDLVIKQL